MNCRTCSNMLSAYRDQELTGREMLAVREHLSGCSSCQEELASLEAIHRALGRLSDARVPAGLEGRLQTAVFQPKPRGGVPLQMAAWGGLAAAAAFCAVAVFHAFQPPIRAEVRESFPTGASDLAYTDAADPLGVYVPAISISNNFEGR